MPKLNKHMFTIEEIRDYKNYNPIRTLITTSIDKDGIPIHQFVNYLANQINNITPTMPTLKESLKKEKFLPSKTNLNNN